jgi:lactam utilization protein B
MKKIAVGDKNSPDVKDHIEGLLYNVGRLNTFMKRIDGAVSELKKFSNMTPESINRDKKMQKSFIDACNNLSDNLDLLKNTSEEVSSYQTDFENSFFKVED